MPERRDPEAKAIEAAFACAVELGWRHTTLADIADRAGITLAELYDLFPSRAHLLVGYVRMTDRAMLAGMRKPGAEESVRDRLFDLLMRRFDAHQRHRRGIEAIARDIVADPAALLMLRGAILRSLGWCLEAAGVPSRTLRGRVRLRGLAAIYGAAFRVWLRDESEDMARTMAELDRRLNDAERLMSRLGHRPRRREGEAPPPEAGAGVAEPA